MKSQKPLTDHQTRLEATSGSGLKSLLFYFILCTLTLTACTTGLKKRNILVIGDSNGSVANGWVYQFQRLRKGGPIVNTSASGNTVGFDGMGTSKLNTLDQLVVYLRKGYAELGSIDEIIIALGTNDCKYEYRDATADRHVNYRKLLEETKKFFTERGQEIPRIVILSPPPAAVDAVVNAEFKGASSCVEELAGFLAELALEGGYCYSNLLLKPGQQLLSNSPDGIHFDAIGYEKIARQLLEDCY